MQVTGRRAFQAEGAVIQCLLCAYMTSLQYVAFRKTIFNKHLTPTAKNESVPFQGGGRLKEHRGKIPEKQQQHLHCLVFIYLSGCTGSRLQHGLLLW